jgi:hypothetical protein
MFDPITIATAVGEVQFSDKHSKALNNYQASRHHKFPEIKQVIELLEGNTEPLKEFERFFLFDSLDPLDAILILVSLMPCSDYMDRCDSVISKIDDIYGSYFFLDSMPGKPIFNLGADVVRIDGLSVSRFEKMLGTQRFPRNASIGVDIWIGVHEEISSRLYAAYKLAEIWETGNHPTNLNIEYFIHWAHSKRHEIAWLDWATKQGFIKPDSIIVSEKEPLSKLWEEVTVSLLANHRIALKSDDNRREFSMFDLGLVDKRTNKLNVSGRALVRLSERRKYPLGRIATEAEKNVMKKLRASLKSAANMNKNPFTTPNASDGWKPRFTLIDSRNAADVRARQRAIKVPYDDSRGYDQEHDAAGDFLREHEE